MTLGVLWCHSGLFGQSSWLEIRFLFLPFFVAKSIAFFLETLPNPLLTRDQINLLHYDSVSTKGIANLRKIVKNPISMETVVKNYL